MAGSLVALALSALAPGCAPRGREPVVVEDRTPIVGADRATSEAVGIETLGGVFTEIVKAGTRVPCSASETFSTAADGQSQITLELYRGSESVAARNRALGAFQVVNIPSAPRGVPKVSVTFAITDRQILLSARDLARKTDLEIRRIVGGGTP